MKRVFGIFLIVLLAFSTLSLLGCGGFKMQEVYTLLEAGNPEAAFVYMAKKGPREDSVWADTRNFTKESGFLFERGLVAHYAKRFSESTIAFFLTEDISKSYPGTQFERLMRHYYQILNYIYLNRWDQVLIECRRAMAYINNSEDESGNYIFIGAGLVTHLSGMCFEAAGEWNDAFISYQQAEIFYQQAALKTEIKMPVDVGEALVRLARRLELTNEASRYQIKYGEPDTHADGMGEFVLFYESGYVPPTSNEKLMFPILKNDIENDAFREDNRDNKTIAQSFVVDRLLSREGQFYSDKELEYVLYVDLPARPSNRPYLTGILAEANNTQQNGVLVGDSQAMVLETHNAKRPALLVQTVTNVFLEYLTYRVDKSNAAQREKRQKEHEKELEKLKGVEKMLYETSSDLEITMRFGLKNEPKRPTTGNADKRSWKTLPNQIFFVRMLLPKGIHNVTLSFLDANGQNRESQILRDVEVSPNRITFINYRTYK